MSYRIDRADVDSMFNAVNYIKDGATGSVRQYFYDQSYGEYNPQFDIYGPVTVSGTSTQYSDCASKLVLEACALMDDSLDFTLYNLDGDDKVDLMYCLFAGPPASDSPTWVDNPNALIWPHYWTIAEAGSHGQPTVFDGLTINDYEVSSELDGFLSDASTAIIAGVGLACHEFGHGMGLPDVYSTNDNATHKTSGYWDIMDYCYGNDGKTPAAYSAYERWFMGWLEPMLLNQAYDVQLGDINTTQSAAYITANGSAIADILSPNPNVFYLLENRQKAGWDAYLPGHGMLVTKVTYDSQKWKYNRVNYSASAMCIDLLEADGSAPAYPNASWYGKPGDTYPTGSTSFTKVANYQVTEIAEANGVITFKVNGGGTPTELDTQETGALSKPRKILRDGRVVILRGEKEYDILGRVL
jgi:M6 family metalloprotease-like protein